MQDSTGEAPQVTLPICPVCNRAVGKSPQECPHCHVAHHPNCWRQVTFCPTCGIRNPERVVDDPKDGGRTRKKPYVKRGEAITFTHNDLIRDLATYLTVPGSTMPPVGLFLFLFRKEAPAYLYLMALGLLLMAGAWVLRTTGRARHVISPSTRSIQRQVALAGISWTTRLMSFDDVASFRIEGERRYKGDQKGVPSYWYSAYWVVAIDRTTRHVRLSDEIRTDQDPTYNVGSDYAFAGLLPLAHKAGSVVGVDVYVAPQLGTASHVPLIIKALALAIVAVLFVLLS